MKICHLIFLTDNFKLHADNMKLHVICRYINCVGYCVADTSSEISTQNSRFPAQL